MDRGNHEIDSLLAPRALSGREREQVLEQVLRGVAPARNRCLARGFTLAAIGLAACASLVLVLWRWDGKERPFAARGSSGAGAHVELLCSGGTLSACPRGSRLLFAVTGGARPAYLAAYAEPVGGGERIWYLSSERRAEPVGTGTAPDEPIDVAIEIGPEHLDGRYIVHILTGAHPLSRAEALSPDARSILMSETVELGIVP
jgi:hypothetical protein